MIRPSTDSTSTCHFLLIDLRGIRLSTMLAGCRQLLVGMLLVSNTACLTVCRVWDGRCASLASPSLSPLRHTLLQAVKDETLFALDMDGASIDLLGTTEPESVLFVATATNKTRATALYKEGTGLLVKQSTVQGRDKLNLAVAYWPHYAAAHGNLGAAWESEDIQAALWHYKAALVVTTGSEYAEAKVKTQFNYAKLLLRSGDYSEAEIQIPGLLRVAAPDAALALEINYEHALYWAKRNETRSYELLKQVLQNSDRWGRINRKAVVQLVSMLQEGVRREPRNTRKKLLLARYVHTYTENIRMYRELLQSVLEEKHPVHPMKLCERATVLFDLALKLPAIYVSMEHIAAERRRFSERLIAIREQGLRLSRPLTHRAGDSLSCVVSTLHFMVAYQGLNPRPLVELLAATIMEVMPSLKFPHAPKTLPWGDRRTRVGVVCSHNNPDHSVGKVFDDILHRFPKEKIELFALLTNRAPKVAKLYTDNGVEHVLSLGNHSFDQLRSEIHNLSLDVLVYLQLGMDSVSYFLAYSRLAPIQCCTHGHPSTSGIPTMDYFISYTDEVAHAQEHYTERLVKFETGGFAMKDPTKFKHHRRSSAGYIARTRADFGLPADRTLYLCPQPIFKLHPAMDELFGRVLRADPQGLVVLIGLSPSTRNQLHARFERTIADVSSRIVDVITNGEEDTGASYHLQQDLLDLLEASDVMLDSHPVSGGTSTYEALALGVPVVTMPAETMNTRFTFEALTKLGLRELVANSSTEYARIAVEIGTSSQEAKQAMRQRIKSAAHSARQSRRTRAVEEWTQFITGVTNQKRHRDGS